MCRYIERAITIAAHTGRWRRWLRGRRIEGEREEREGKGLEHEHVGEDVEVVDLDVVGDLLGKGLLPQHLAVAHHLHALCGRTQDKSQRRERRGVWSNRQRTCEPSWKGMEMFWRPPLTGKVREDEPEVTITLAGERRSGRT
jgi:hypothetical protein